MLSNFIGFVTRREGKKFLELGEGIDESIATGSALGRDEVALYIHIPFCKTLCPFCCFNRYLFTEEKAKKYFKHLKKEVDFYIQRGSKFSNFYFGGGTPTVMMDELIEFINYLKQNFEVKQISLETNPNEVNRKIIELLKAAGVNRLSIGIQSFDNDILKAVGRVFCTGEEMKETLQMVEGEFDTLNVDFIFNFPGQSIEQFEADIETFKNLGIDQATFYPLMASPHKKNAIERRFNRIDMSREKKFHDVILRDLYTAGYKASTAWCFSRGEHMIDEYIINYDDYIGIGAGSVSIVNGNFYVNSFALDRYEEFIANNKLPIIGWRKLSERENLHYYLLTKLFGLTVDTNEFHRRFNADIHKKLRSELLFLRLFGLIQGEKRIKVTQKGMYPVSVIMREFFTALNDLREYYIEKQI
ncbi:coproporphyrinogen III oxidase family protein [Chloroflexota bacterium]